MKRRIASSLGLVLATLSLLACEGGPPPTTTGPATSVKVVRALGPAAEDRSVVVAMHEDYRAVDDVLDAIVSGDLGRASASAWVLAVPPDASLLPEGWESWANGIRRYAADIVVEDDPGAAARYAAALLEQCGACHTAAAAPVPLPTTVERPADASGAPARMLLHAWASTRMAEGLLAPSDERWVAGAEALAVAPLIPESVVARADPWLEDARQLARQVGETALAARDAATPKERRDAYARYLETCVSCHALFRIGTTRAH